MARLPTPTPNASTLDGRYLTSHEGKPTEDDLTFDHIPYGHEVLMHGGAPGVQYMWCLPEHVDEVVGLPPEQGSEFQWDLCDFKWRINIRGPRGTVRGVFLLARGVPIRGASPQAGRRKWFSHNEIFLRTGLGNPAHEKVAGQLEAMDEQKRVEQSTAPKGSRYTKEAAA